MQTDSYRPGVRLRATGSLKPPERRVAVHSDEQVAAIARTIQHWTFVDPIITDGKSGIVGRLGWWLAARQLGLEKVPTIALSALSDADRRGFVIAHEALARQVGWDDELLAVEVAELKGLGFDLTLTALGDDRLAAMLVRGNEAPPASKYAEQYGVIVLCKDEPDQQRVYEKLKGDGFACRVVTT